MTEIKTCKLCGENNKNFSFRILRIEEVFKGDFHIGFGYGGEPTEENRFKYCPECGRKLTENDFKAWYEKD